MQIRQILSDYKATYDFTIFYTIVQYLLPFFAPSFILFFSDSVAWLK